MFEVSAIIVVAFAFAVAVAYAINKNAKGEPASKPAPVVPEVVPTPQSITLPGGGTVDIPAIPSTPAPAPAPAAKPKPKKKKAKAPAATYSNPVQNVAPDGTKEPPPVNTWKM